MGKGKCNECVYPYTTVSSGNTLCTTFCICWGVDFIWLVILTSFFITVVGVMMAKRREVKVTAMFLHLVFPTYDALSDIAYLTGTPFYDKIIFVFTALFMSFSLFMYIRDIYILNAYP